MMTKLPGILRRLKDGFKSRGFAYLPQAILSRLPRWLYFYDRQLLTVTNGFDIPVRHYADYELQQITEEELPKLTGVPFSIRRAGRELRGGSICFAVTRAGRPVAWRWAATGTLYISYGNTVVHTGDNGYYSYRLETIPEERFRGHVNAIFMAMQSYFAASNRTRDYTLISMSNIPNLRMHMRCGFKAVGKTTVLNILGLHFCFYKQWPFHTKRLTLTLGKTPKGMRAL